jgi:hypothetical protein
MSVNYVILKTRACYKTSETGSAYMSETIYLGKINDGDFSMYPDPQIKYHGKCISKEKLETYIRESKKVRYEYEVKRDKLDEVTPANLRHHLVTCY